METAVWAEFDDELGIVADAEVRTQAAAVEHGGFAGELQEGAAGDELSLADIAFAVAGTPIEIAVKSALLPLGEDDVEETPIVDVVIDLPVVVAVAFGLALVS